MQDKAREFVKNEIDPEYLRRMDRDEIRFPRELYENYARHGLLGLRFPKRYGGQELSWVAECAAMEEIGCLGMAAGCGTIVLTGSRGVFAALLALAMGFGLGVWSAKGGRGSAAVRVVMLGAASAPSWSAR